MGIFRKLVSVAAPLAGSFFGPAGLMMGTMVGQMAAEKAKTPDLPAVREMPNPDDPEAKKKRMRAASRKYRNLGRAGTMLTERSGGRLG